MGVTDLLNQIKSSYTPTCTSIQSYQDEAIYCRITLNNKSLAISLNLRDKKIYIYYRDKSCVDDLVSFIDTFPPELFTRQGNVFVMNLIEQPDEQKKEKFIFCVKKFDHLCSSTQLKIKKLIDGSSHDSQDNLVEAPVNLKNCFVQFKGKHNRLIIHPDADLQNVFIEFLGDHGLVELGQSISMTGQLRLGHHCKIYVGNHVSSTNPVYMTCAEATQIYIGDDCMFATNNQIRTDDAHAIYDTETGKRVNPSKNIRLGHHVWVGYGAVILGGADIGDGAVVAMSALVKKKFPNNCVIAGVPAKMTKKNIFWERPNILSFTQEQGQYVTGFEQRPYCQATHE